MNRGDQLFADYEALDRALVEAGFPATSPWWREQVRRYFTSTMRQAVWRVGRRGGKSSTLCRVAVIEALYGGHEVPPGDVGHVAIISTDREEAQRRLSTIESILGALGVGYRTQGHRIALPGRRVAFAVFTASIRGVSGFTSILVICDEVAKWRDADTGANPATEVLASVRPTMATMPNARIVLISSPMGSLDAHAKAFAAGDTATQIVASAPTWVAHPALTQESTHADEPDERRWLREYGAVPMEGDESSLLTSSMLDKAIRPQRGDVPPERGVAYVGAMDPGFTRNAWTFAIACRRYVDGQPRRSVVLAREWRGTPSIPLNPRHILSAIAELARPYAVDTVYTDQYERFGLGAIGMEPDIGLHVIVPSMWTAPKRLAAFESLETWAAGGELDLPNDPQLRADLLAVRQKLTANGFTLSLPQTPDGRHADYAPSVVMALALAMEAAPAPVVVIPPDKRLEAEGRELEERIWEEQSAPKQDAWEANGY